MCISTKNVFYLAFIHHNTFSPDFSVHSTPFPPDFWGKVTRFLLIALQYGNQFLKNQTVLNDN